MLLRSKHEELKASIAKARAERIMYDIRIAQMLAGPQEEEMSEEPEQIPQESKPRTLKKNK